MFLLEVLQVVIQPINLLALVIAIVVALFGGALPGVGGALILTLIIPFTYRLEPATALIMMGAVYTVAVYGGGISAILLNIPGTSGSAATCLDGYKMSQQGKGVMALGISVMGSAIGAIASTILLMISAGIVFRFVLLFGPAEYFWITILGMTIIASLSSGGMIKGLVAAAFGFLLGFVGQDAIIGYGRFSFDSVFLWGGLHLIPVLLGFFALSEVFDNITKKRKAISEIPKLEGSVFEGMKVVFQYPRTTIRSIIIGFLVGAMPGVGYAVANWIGYSEARRNSKHPELFGEGHPEGVLAPETANNASVGGALLPTLVFGIPGGATAAILLGGLMIHGIIPGSQLFVRNVNLLYTLYVGLILAAILMVVIGVLLFKYIAKVTIIPLKYLTPVIFVVIFSGSFAIRNNVNDVLVTIVLGIIAYFMKKNKYPVVCTVIAFILGPIMESNLNRTVIISRGSFIGLVKNPLSWVLIALTLLMIVSYVIRSRKPAGSSRFDIKGMK